MTILLCWSNRIPSNLSALAAWIQGRVKKAVLEVKRMISILGLKGVFLHPWEEGYRVSADFVVPVAKAAAELGVPVMIAAGYPWVSMCFKLHIWLERSQRLPSL